MILTKLRIACLINGLRVAFVVASMFVLPGAGTADEKPLSKIVSREDVVYGRVHGAGLLADIAYPESKQPLPAILSVHGGRWVGGHKKDASAIKVEQWAGFGFSADNS